MADNIPQDEKSDMEAATDNTLLVAWEAEAYISYRNDSRWYGSVVALGIFLSAIAYLLRYQLQVSLWFVMPVIAAATVVMIVRSMAKPPTVPYGVSRRGVVINGTTIPYTGLRSFAVLDIHEHTVLRLWPMVRLALPTTIILEHVDAQTVRELIGGVLNEDTAEHSWSDQISHWLKL